jgi:hypothetical protein
MAKKLIPSKEKEQEHPDIPELTGLLGPFKYGFRNRNIILSSSLLIEKTTSSFIANLLGIKKPENSLTLGIKSSAFSFNQKIDLLIDLGALNTSDKRKFQLFMELRNKFMHVLEADSFVNCFKLLDGKEAFLFKLYPQYKDKADENNLKAASIRLADDVHQLTLMIIKKVLEKRYREEVKMSAVKGYFEANQNLLNTFDAFIQYVKQSGMEIGPELLEPIEKIREQNETIQKTVFGILID